MKYFFFSNIFLLFFYLKVLTDSISKMSSIAVAPQHSFIEMVKIEFHLHEIEK